MDALRRLQEIQIGGDEDIEHEPFTDNDGEKHEAPENVNAKPIDIDLNISPEDPEIPEGQMIKLESYMNTGAKPTPATDCPIVKVRDYRYLCYLIGPIKDVHAYIPLMDLLLNMGHNDTLEIYLDSPGGYVSSGGIISSLIDSCKGKVYTDARGICASAAALIHSSPPDKGHITVSDFAVLMYHMSSHGDSGNSMGIANRANNQVRYVEESLLRKALEDGHITQEDLAAIKSGKDIFVSAKEFVDGRNSADPDISSFNENAGMYVEDHDLDKVNEDDPKVADDDIDSDYFGLDVREIDPSTDEVHTEGHTSVAAQDIDDKLPMFYTTPATMNPAIYFMEQMKKYNQPRLSVVDKDNFRIYMEAGQVFPPGYIASICQFLDTRSEGQTVTFILGTRMYDTQAHDMGAIISSMQDCKAHVITRAEGYCSVTETMIWMYGKTRTVGRYGALSFNIMNIVDRCPAYMQYFNIFLNKAKEEGIITIPEFDAIMSTRSELMIMGDRLK